MSPRSARAVQIASPSSGAGRQNELRRLSQPAQRNGNQRWRHEYSADTKIRRPCFLEPKRNLLRVSHSATWAIRLRARSAASRLCGLPFTAWLREPATVKRTQRYALPEVSFPGAKDAGTYLYWRCRSLQLLAARNLLVCRLPRRTARLQRNPANEILMMP